MQWECWSCKTAAFTSGGSIQMLKYRHVWDVPEHLASAWGWQMRHRANRDLTPLVWQLKPRHKRMLEISRDTMPVFKHESSPFSTCLANRIRKTKVAKNGFIHLGQITNFKSGIILCYTGGGLVYFYFIDYNAWLENIWYPGPLGIMITKMVGNWHILTCSALPQCFEQEGISVFCRLWAYGQGLEQESTVTE